MPSSKPILLVEDDHVYAIMAERVLKNLGVRNLPIHNTNSRLEFGGML
jgi:ActR/RegA family two-component response regulator